MVLQGYVGELSEIQEEMLYKAFESNERQIQIINQILNAARVDTGRLVMTVMPIDLCALVRGVAEDMRSSLEQRKHTFVVQLPSKVIRVLADLGYLRMAVENLLHNASIYTPDGGRVTLCVELEDDSMVRISVTDTGVGIKKSRHKQVCSPSFRAFTTR
jgi:signal transduction histidine kinase